MPKQPHRMVLGVLDENSYTIMNALNMSDGKPKSFLQLLTITGLPKSSLYVTLMKMLENGLVERIEFNYRLSNNGQIIYNTFKQILEKRTLKTDVTKLEKEEKRGAFQKLIEGFRKIFGK
ncbi:MAG: hypothetical protein N3F64_00975 [Nitrososphaeria archaeon]|nr:hypothetical protein [Nitrososphaeria archaeon]